LAQLEGSDHFLFMNGYPAAIGCDLTVAPYRSVVNCSITLANGAFFTMAMTDGGSERIGPQDYVELRANGRTGWCGRLDRAGHRRRGIGGAAGSAC
jgi:hypothetical protein